MSYLPPEQAKTILTNILMDFAESDELGEYLEHCKFDIGAITTARELLPAWLGHYRVGQGTYDTDKAGMDLLTWPPISRRVFELQAQSRV